MKKYTDHSKLENFYSQLTNRNIGLISILDQKKIREASITIFGVGGLGGPISEQLTRIGCESLKLCDHDKFELTDLNRQICTIDDIGKSKVEATEDYLKRINPNINIEKYSIINLENISEILRNTDIVLLTLDDPIISILIARESRKRQIPLLESWGIPILWAWWFTEKSVDYETCYGFPTKNKNILEINSSKDLLVETKNNIFKKLLTFPKIRERYNREEGVFDKVIMGALPLVSLAPIVRMTASYLAFETIFSGILEVKKKNLAPKIVGFDYFDMIKVQIK